jgi:hypothetical protein
MKSWSELHGLQFRRLQPGDKFFKLGDQSLVPRLLMVTEELYVTPDKSQKMSLVNCLDLSSGIFQQVTGDELVVKVLP